MNKDSYTDPASSVEASAKHFEQMEGEATEELAETPEEWEHYSEDKARGYPEERML
jgi:hypothetical protein